MLLPWRSDKYYQVCFYLEDKVSTTSLRYQTTIIK